MQFDFEELFEKIKQKIKNAFNELKSIKDKVIDDIERVKQSKNQQTHR